MKKSIFILVITVIIISIFSGAIFQTSLAPSDEIKTYLNEFLWNLKSDVHNKNIFINALKDNFMTLAVLAVCGFFKLGCVPSFIVTARKCFVTAFSVSAFMYYYNLKGFFAAAALSLPFMILLAALAIMCSVSVTLSLSSDRVPAIKAYIAFFAASAISFTAAAIAEGYIVPSLILLILH